MSDPRDLLELVFAQPDKAVARARALLAGKPSHFDASTAHHVIGLALREYGDLNASIVELRRALMLARRSGSDHRTADVLATLGIALVQLGRTGAGLRMLRESVWRASGALAGRVRFRRAGALWILGRHREALADLSVSIPVLRRARDKLWTARALTLRGLVHLALGSVRRASGDLTVAEHMFAEIRERHASATALHNKGLVAFKSGDLPAALACLDEVAGRFRSLGTPTLDLVIDRCVIMLAAGLIPEVIDETQAAIDHSQQLRGRVTRRAEILLIAARAKLAAGLPTEAERLAAEAAGLFATQHRQWWYAHARLVLLQARFAATGASSRLRNQAIRVVRQLEALGSPEVVLARLLAGRVELAIGTRSREQLVGAARARHRGPAISRVDGWLARALLAEADGADRRVLAACRRGLDTLEEHRLTLGATELRARATARGAELAVLGEGVCVRAGSPRRLLVWSERWRATAFAVPPVRPPDHPAARGELAALRDITSRLWLAHERGTPTHLLEIDRSQLERRVRDRALRTPGRAGGRPEVLDVGRLLAELGPGRLVELVDIDGDIHVLVCGAGRVRRLRAGRSALAIAAVESVRVALRRLAYQPDDAGQERLLSRLMELGQRLQEILLGPAVRHLGEGPIVIVPPGLLHGVPWALLPALADRVHGVAPSAVAWLNSRTATAPADSRVVLVRGPGLDSLGAEVPVLRDLYPGARVLEDGTATAAGVLAALDSVELAHIAAHGSFRGDNPLFSSIRLDDGPLTVYDFERLRRAPRRIVLPSCDSGRLQPIGADELLGLTAALLPLGTAGIVASLVPINDAATVPLMVALHESLRTGASCAQALHDARRGVPEDPVHRATAASFVALGAG